MRSEYHERIRRKLDENPQYGYTKASPWSAVFAASVRETEFWTKEIVTPATLQLARTNSLAIDRSWSEEPERPSPKKKHKNQTASSKAGPKKGVKRKYTGEDKSQWDESAKCYSVNRKGIPICIKFNRGECGNGKPQSRCSANRSHQCNKCLGPQMASQCKAPAKNWPNQVKLIPASEARSSKDQDKGHGQHKKSASGSNSSKDNRLPLKRKFALGEAKRRSRTTSPKGEKKRAKRKPPEDKARKSRKVSSSSDASKSQTTEVSSEQASSKHSVTSLARSIDIPKMPLYCENRYGATNVDPQQWDDRPKAFLLFSSRPRDGDLACYLNRFGWIVVVADKLGPTAVDLLDPKIRKQILADIAKKMYDVVGIATPCETVSPLRSNPPGPRPLRSLEKPDGLSQKDLNKQEWKQLQEADTLIEFSTDCVSAQRKAGNAFWLENPDHDQKLDMWKTSRFKAMMGSAIVEKDVRCNHEKQEWKREDGSTYYKAAHQSLLQRWRTGPDGKQERASKALGEYPSALNFEIMRAMARIKRLPRVNAHHGNQAEDPSAGSKKWGAMGGAGPALIDQAQKDRELENAKAIGGMRNPSESVEKLKGYAQAGKVLFKLLWDASDHQSVLDQVRSMLSGSPANPICPELVNCLRRLIVGLNPKGSVKLPDRTAKAGAPISAEIIAAWGKLSGDPDTECLSTWLLQGAPLGFTQPIPNTGIFPKVDSIDWETEAATDLHRSFLGWTNHPSATEWEEDLVKLCGRCSFQKILHFLWFSRRSWEREIGLAPVLNKLGVIVKEKETPSGIVRKARIIWDMRESKVNQLCNQGERILLPKVTDVIDDIISILRSGGRPSFVAIDIRDAFHNIPSGIDRAFTAAAFTREGKKVVLVYDVLVFGSVSSPTIWGRFASWFTRSAIAINPKVKLQTYVDDPIMVFDKDDPQYERLLGITLLWAAIAGFPVKLEKTDAGDEVRWIGAWLSVNHIDRTAIVTIPKDKVSELLEKVRTYSTKTMIGRKQLQSLAGALSFAAGIVPLMRPFLNALWAALATNDGSERTRNLVHVRRIAVALQWIEALLGNEPADFVRVVRAIKHPTKAIIITDASTYGMGAVLLVDGIPKEFFTTPIPFEFIKTTGAVPGEPKFMALWEALCLLLAARTWLTRYPLGSVIRVKSDNLGALYLLAKGKAKSPELAIAAREIALDQAKGRYEFTILQHINTKLNKIADPLSRQHDPEPPPFPSQLLGNAIRVPVNVTNDFWLLPRISRRSRTKAEKFGPGRERELKWFDVVCFFIEELLQSWLLVVLFLCVLKRHKGKRLRCCRCCLVTTTFQIRGSRNEALVRPKVLDTGGTRCRANLQAWLTAASGRPRGSHGHVGTSNTRSSHIGTETRNERSTDEVPLTKQWTR